MSILGSVAKSALRAAGYYRRRLRAGAFPGPIVLCYHAVLPEDADRSAIPFEPLHVSADRLEQHCRALTETCDPIDLPTFIAGLEGRSAWPKRPVLLTFDDGYRNLLTVAAPILARHRVPGVVFACTGAGETGEALWTDRVARVHGEAEVERLKEAPDAERRAVVATAPGYPFTHDHLKVMTPDELKALVSEPGWSVGGHTHSHPILARCPADVQEEEIVVNLEKLRQWVRNPVDAFAYPNGRPGRDYDDVTRSVLAVAGVRLSFTTGAGFVVDRERPYDLPRMLMTNGVSGTELLHRLAISWRK